MRRKQPAQLFLLVALVATIGGITLSTPASSAPVISDQKADKAVKALVHPSLIRAEIVTFSAGEVGDYRIYRGVVRKIRPRLVTLAERDGAVVRVKLSSATQIRLDNRKVAAKRVRPGMRATVMKSGDAAASWLYVVKKSFDKSGPKIKSLLSTDFMRAEVVSWVGGELLYNRADTGVIESVDETSLTLQESDGTTVQLQINDTSQAWVNNKEAGATDLATGMSATTISDGDGVVDQIWAQGKKLVVGKK